LIALTTTGLSTVPSRRSSDLQADRFRGQRVGPSDQPVAFVRRRFEPVPLSPELPDVLPYRRARHVQPAADFFAGHVAVSGFGKAGQNVVFHRPLSPSGLSVPARAISSAFETNSSRRLSSSPRATPSSSFSRMRP